jgi:hypothetical protein
MKTKILYSFLLAFFLVGSAFAQEQGTTGAMHLLVPTTARTIGLGTTLASGLKNMNPLEALNGNPAGLALNTGTAAMFSRVNYVADIGINNFGVAQNFGQSSAALTFTSWNYGEIPRQTEAVPEIADGVTYGASNTTIGLAYARQMTDRISAGVNIQLVNEQIDDMSSSRLAIDGGMTYVVGESGLRFGVSLQNFGPKSGFSGSGLNRFAKITTQSPNAAQTNFALQGESFELPSALNFGAAYTKTLAGDINATVAGNFRSLGLGPDNFSGGLELGFKNLFYVRGGYSVTGANADQTMFSGLSYGAGLNLGLGGTQLSVDYAYRATKYFSAPQTITVGVKL